MLFSIPGKGNFELEHLVLDFNGTIARDGQLISNLHHTIIQLSKNLDIHVLTSDTGGTVLSETADLPCKLHIISDDNEAVQKQQYVKDLGSDKTICFGNGANDCLMLKEACIGVVIIEGEGAATTSVMNSDIVCRSIYDAFGLLMVPLRLTATLRI